VSASGVGANDREQRRQYDPPVRVREQISYASVGARERKNIQNLIRSTIRRCTSETVRIHKCERNSAFALTNVSETVRFAWEKNARTNREFPQSFVCPRTRRIAATQRHAVTSRAHTHMRPWGRAPGRKTARGDGRRMQLAHWLPHRTTIPLSPSFPPGPSPRGESHGREYT